MIDAIDDGLVGILGRRRAQHAFGARLDMGHRGLFRVEGTGALHDDINAHITPGQLGRIAVGNFLDLAEAGIDPVIANLDLAGIATMDTVIGQEVSIGFGRRTVIDRDDLDLVPALVLENRAQRQTADTTKTGNRNPKGHTHLS